MFHVFFMDGDKQLGAVKELFGMRNQDFGTFSTADIYYIFKNVPITKDQKVHVDTTDEMSLYENVLMLAIGFSIAKTVVIHVGDAQRKVMLQYLKLLSDMYSLESKLKIIIRCREARDIQERMDAEDIFPGRFTIVNSDEGLAEFINGEKKEMGADRDVEAPSVSALF